MLACDLLVAARDARFGLPEAKRGLVAGAGGVIRLPRLIPQRIAMQMVLTGDMMGAERLYELGLVNVLTEPGGALAAAKEMARTIIDNVPLSVTLSKHVINEQRDWPNDAIWDMQDAILGDFRNFNDAKEGALAFLEKRKPKWTGT